MRIEDHGLGVDVPETWDGRVVRDGASVVLEAASVRLGHHDRASVETHPAMGPDDLYLRIFETELSSGDVATDESWAAGALPLSFTRNDLSPVFENTSLPAFGVRFWIVDGRCLTVNAGFGPHPDRGQPVWPKEGAPVRVPVSHERLQQLNAVLATLRMEART